MNPGVTEEVGSTARSVIHVLESQPLSLAMIISNFALLAFLWYTGAENNKQRAELGRAIFQEHKETRELLAKCIVPEHKTFLPKAEPMNVKPVEPDEPHKAID